MSCATADCGRPECDVCRWGRLSAVQKTETASTVDLLRAGAKAEPTKPKARHTGHDGPHRSHPLGPVRLPQEAPAHPGDGERPATD